MPRQTKNQTTTEPAVATPVVEVPATPVEKKSRASRKKVVEPLVEETPVVAPQPVETPAPHTDDTPTTGEETTTQRPPRTVPTRDGLMTSFSELLSILDQQTTQLREGSDKASNNIRFLRSVTKRVRELQASSARLLRQKQPSQRKNNNSGFLKPVKISAEMAKFTGLDPATLHSRVDVTKFICNYIADKNLQNPSDRRQINADPALAKLLGHDAKKSEKALTYYHMQSLLKNHFTKSA
jgi:chromatin remodeling complex protein RSC6